MTLILARASNVAQVYDTLFKINEKRKRLACKLS